MSKEINKLIPVGGIGIVERQMRDFLKTDKAASKSKKLNLSAALRVTKKQGSSSFRQ